VNAAWETTSRITAEEALRQSRKDLSRAEEVGQMGWWRLDTRRNVLTCPTKTTTSSGAEGDAI